MPAPQQNWMALGAGGLTSAHNGDYGSLGRDPLDTARLGVGRTPGAEYPDGYLGTIRSRRDDRLLNSLKARMGQRSYQRGVHKGARVDIADYLWPPELSPQRGLENQAAGVRTAPLMQLAPAPHLVNDGKGHMRADSPVAVNPYKNGGMLPRWSRALGG
jgi:hypothetical protein